MSTEPKPTGQNDENPVVVAEHVQKSFGKFTAISDVNFTVKRGEIVGLLGANGAGKTTLIQMLLGLLSPSSGKIRIFGMDPEKDRISILRRANFSSAYVSLPYNLKVWENLDIFAGLYCIKNKKEKIDHLLELFGVKHLKTRMTGRLSSGESTRVNLCKALLNDPEILFLDEPTASLDPDIADKVRKLLARYREEHNVTMIYTSHNMRDVEELCDRIMFVAGGKIIADGQTSDILSKFEEQSLEELFIKIARDGEITTLGGTNEETAT
ncbi:MAG: ABC transporter ATP-binding protein [Candidatus Melainabacteria bacterium]|nr:ABC transporter ATP-binding protein [Candidatus Melainabacteria bacterium]